MRNSLERELINNDFYKITGLPPVLQVIHYSINVDFALIVLTFGHRLLIDEDHPRGLELSIPHIKEIRSFSLDTYLLDMGGNLYCIGFYEDFGNKAFLERVESSLSKIIAENVRLLTFDLTRDQLISVTIDNQFLVFEGNKVIHSIQLEDEVQGIDLFLILFINGKLEIFMNNKLRPIDQFDWKIRDFCYHKNYLFLILEDNTLVKYAIRNMDDRFLLDINYMKRNQALRFIRYKNECYIEDMNHRILTMQLRDDNFISEGDLEIINISKVENDNKRLLTTKSAKAR